MNIKHLSAMALCLLLASCGGQAEEENHAPLQQQNNQPVADKATQLYEGKCMTCHGADGTAGIGNAANLRTSKLDSASIIYTVAKGKGAMPPFKDQLNEEELQKLAGYVLGLRK